MKNKKSLAESVVELKKDLVSSYKQRDDLLMLIHSGNTGDLAKLRLLRKTIARLNTRLREKELSSHG